MTRVSPPRRLSIAGAMPVHYPIPKPKRWLSAARANAHGEQQKVRRRENAIRVCVWSLTRLRPWPSSLSLCTDQRGLDAACVQPRPAFVAKVVFLWAEAKRPGRTLRHGNAFLTEKTLIFSPSEVAPRDLTRCSLDAGVECDFFISPFRGRLIPTRHAPLITRVPFAETRLETILFWNDDAEMQNKEQGHQQNPCPRKTK